MRIATPCAPEMDAAGYSALCHIPFLVSDAGEYLDIPNRYLRERALGEWVPKLRVNQQDEESRQARLLTKASCMAMAKQIRHFLEWCSATDKDWREVQYLEDLVLQWQFGLLAGNCSPSGRPLSAGTVNHRVSEATYFLVWAQERGFRSRVSVKTAPTTGFRGGATRKRHSTAQRAAALAVPPSQMSLPSPEAVGRWLSAIALQRGPVKRLCCELIVSTGIRLGECVAWRYDTLPPREAWHVVNGEVEVEIRFGCKGPKLHPGSDEALRPRSILVPLGLAERIDAYRAYQRPVQIRRWARSATDAVERARRARLAPPARLWLGERSNRPFSSSQLYQTWRSVADCPPGWHPHAGRAFFAVERLVEHTRMMLETHASDDVPSMDWLYGIMANQVQIILRPLMGHLSDDTTYIYLKAVRARLASEVGHPAVRWQQYCDDEIHGGVAD